jgi:carboxymethylenebutenolidase
MTKHDVQITTADGQANGMLFVPQGPGPWPGVIYYPDGVGVRPGFERMAERLSQEGFVVLLVNVFYRSTSGHVFGFKPNFKEDATRQRFGDVTKPLTNEALAQDIKAYVDFLKSRGEVKGKLGVVGYCYAGRLSMMTAALHPDAVAAAASFHGGRLCTDDAGSPHLTLLPKIKAALLFGHASNDSSMPAEAIAKFEAALKDWGGDFSSETYPASHGWTVPDDELGVYDRVQADRHFNKLKSFFGNHLK